MSGYWICGNCYKLTETRGKTYFCNCGGPKFKIDENMIPIILELNKKGYKTKACCSGHYVQLHKWTSGNTMQGYIYFANGNDIEKKLIVPNTEWDFWNNEKCLRWKFKNPLALFSLYSKLYKAVLALPDISNHTDTGMIPYELWDLFIES